MAYLVFLIMNLRCHMCKRECWAVLSHRTIEATSPSCHCFTLQCTPLTNTLSQIKIHNDKYQIHKIPKTHITNMKYNYMLSMCPHYFPLHCKKLSLHLLISCNHRWHQSREKQQQCKCGVAAAAFVEALTRAALPSNCTSLLGQIHLLNWTNISSNLEKYI